MSEQRRAARGRVIYGGVLIFNNRCSTMSCVVRDFSANGARIEIKHNALLPDHLQLVIARKGREFAARVAWRSEGAAGLEFTEPTASIIPFDRARARAANPGARP
ncbi:PilZ domain-containing protein [Bradyrhizobium sp. 2TAF24]|uniref:PilZ domain-containing protein n=1 Tax=Bradyrhizobium sp. 2TAF24 TaxID=3233011 RepID=UPI003F90EB1E